MKLLVDQNLSYRLKQLLADLFPDSTHISDFNMQRASDSALWDIAKSGQYTIVSKDDDFHQRCFALGHPPKVIWVRLGNCTTDDVAALLRLREPEIRAFGADASASFLALSR